MGFGTKPAGLTACRRIPGQQVTPLGIVAQLYKALNPPIAQTRYKNSKYVSNKSQV